MTVGIIVQARMGSTRLPGKVLMNADRTDTMLDYSIAQLKKCQYVDKIIIATSILERDDVIEQHCKKMVLMYFVEVKKMFWIDTINAQRHFHCQQYLEYHPINH